MSDQSGFAPIANSAGVEKVRRRIDKSDLSRLPLIGRLFKEDLTHGIPLRSILFGALSGDISGGWWVLGTPGSRVIAGDMCWFRHGSGVDRVQAYLCMRLSSGTCLESVELESIPQTTHFFAGGTALGHMVEEQLPRPASWWERFIGGKRAWQVFLHERIIGRIELRYPLTRESILFLQLSNGTSLPIGLAEESSRFVIPPYTPEVCEDDLEMLHFLLVLFFRTTLGLDFCSGS